MKADIDVNSVAVIVDGVQVFPARNTDRSKDWGNLLTCLENIAVLRRDFRAARIELDTASAIAAERGRMVQAARDICFDLACLPEGTFGALKEHLDRLFGALGLDL